MTFRIKELDALRGIAALIVVFFHYTMGRPEAQAGFKFGVTGVDLFFMISGFVIFMSINKVDSGKEFVINRFTRLFPTYWTCVSLTFLFQIINHYGLGFESNINVWQYLANMTMFQHYMKIDDLDGPYWTMIIEMVFYLFILLLFISRQLKHVIAISTVLLALIALYCMLMENYIPQINYDIIYVFPLYSHFALFFAGILFYCILYKQGNLWLNYAMIVICFIVQMNLFDNYPRAATFIGYYEYMSTLGCYFLIFILFINHQLGFIVSRPTLFLGRISFALYLIHQSISIDLIIPQLMKAGAGFWIAALVALLCTILLATLITYLVEIPAGKKLNRLLRQWCGIKARH